MLTRRQFGFTAASAITAFPAGQVRAQQGRNPIAPSDGTPAGETGWSAEVVEIPDFEGQLLRISPDGTRIAGMAYGGALAVLDLASGEVTTDPNTVLSPEP